MASYEKLRTIVHILNIQRVLRLLYLFLKENPLYLFRFVVRASEVDTRNEGVNETKGTKFRTLHLVGAYSMG
jgi:hypothetical protein